MKMSSPDTMVEHYDNMAWVSTMAVPMASANAWLPGPSAPFQLVIAMLTVVN